MGVVKEARVLKGVGEWDSGRPTGPQGSKESWGQTTVSGG